MQLTTCACNDSHDSNGMNTINDINDSNDRLDIANGLETVQLVKA